MSLLNFQQEFKNEDDCWQWILKTRWPNGFICPRCNHTKGAFIKERKKYECYKCHYQVSVTAGTIFHRTRTPLLKWFWLIYRMATSKTGVSILEMKRQLEINDYKTIWAMAHKIRKAMADRDAKYKLAGFVEVDESFFGYSMEGKRGRGSSGKETVIVAVSVWKDKDGKEKPGFAHAFWVEDASADSIENALKKMGIPENEHKSLIEKLRTDGWRSYQTVVNGMKIFHEKVIFDSPKSALSLLPWTHRLIRNAKSVFDGPHRGVSAKHLQKYLSEVCYIFNRRFWYKQSFHRLLKACVSTNTVTRNELMR